MVDSTRVVVGASKIERGEWFGTIESDDWSYSLRVYKPGRFVAFDSRLEAERAAKQVCKGMGLNYRKGA